LFSVRILSYCRQQKTFIGAVPLAHSTPSLKFVWRCYDAKQRPFDTFYPSLPSPPLHPLSPVCASQSTYSYTLVGARAHTHTLSLSHSMIASLSLSLSLVIPLLIYCETLSLFLLHTYTYKLFPLFYISFLSLLYTFTHTLSLSQTHIYSF